ncbi:hypothetical protein MKZ38_009314 [Zalerion maritima]|uniref:Uncharacterized protein n=1 Tax=Zalerion maritima TaxID=339359 RepID=A0AAD5RGY2_9PEZI|nr:hypothetical protein MKZ38_009314 [Zalerion maritima]
MSGFHTHMLHFTSEDMSNQPAISVPTEILPLRRYPCLCYYHGNLGIKCRHRFCGSTCHSFTDVRLTICDKCSGPTMPCVSNQVEVNASPPVGNGQINGFMFALYMRTGQRTSRLVSHILRTGYSPMLDLISTPSLGVNSDLADLDLDSFETGAVHLAGSLSFGSQRAIGPPSRFYTVPLGPHTSGGSVAASTGHILDPSMNVGGNMAGAFMAGNTTGGSTMYESSDLENAYSHTTGMTLSLMPFTGYTGCEDDKEGRFRFIVTTRNRLFPNEQLQVCDLILGCLALEQDGSNIPEVRGHRLHDHLWRTLAEFASDGLPAQYYTFDHPRLNFGMAKVRVEMIEAQIERHHGPAASTSASGGNNN